MSRANDRAHPEYRYGTKLHEWLERMDDAVLAQRLPGNPLSFGHPRRKPGQPVVTIDPLGHGITHLHNMIGDHEYDDEVRWLAVDKTSTTWPHETNVQERQGNSVLAVQLRQDMATRSR